MIYSLSLFYHSLSFSLSLFIPISLTVSPPHFTVHVSVCVLPHHTFYYYCCCCCCWQNIPPLYTVLPLWPVCDTVCLPAHDPKLSYPSPHFFPAVCVLHSLPVFANILFLHLCLLKFSVFANILLLFCVGPEGVHG